MAFFEIKIEEPYYDNSNNIVGVSLAVTFDHRDRTPLVDPATYGIDLVELVKSRKADGEYFIITCHCGVPGCAGIGSGVRITRAGKFVAWSMSEPVSFEKTIETSRYDRAIANLLDRIASDFPLTVTEEGHMEPKAVP